MRFERSVTSISWIPSESMAGLMKVPLEIGIGQYDQAPPDRIDVESLEKMIASDAIRFANRLRVWVEVEGEEIVGAGYSGGGFIASTVARLGVTLKVPGLAFPTLQEPPVIADGSVRFQQTAGGRTGFPLPRRIKEPPFVRVVAPTAWTTLALTVDKEGGTEFEVAGASPFPRHWIYDNDGKLVAKSGLVEYTDWIQTHDHEHSPWHQYDRAILISEVESQIERELSRTVMASRPELVKLDQGATLTRQGEPGGHIYLVLDGMLDVSVDDETVAELGPGAMVGERAVIEEGVATATVRTLSKVLVAKIPADNLDRSALEELAQHHRREELTPGD